MVAPEIARPVPWPPPMPVSSTVTATRTTATISSAMPSSDMRVGVVRPRALAHVAGVAAGHHAHRADDENERAGVEADQDRAGECHARPGDGGDDQIIVDEEQPES